MDLPQTSAFKSRLQAEDPFQIRAASPAKLCFVMLLASFLIVAIAYLLGSIPVGYLLVKLFRHEDIRSVGSGNIGATNVLRSGGKGLGAATFLLDVVKGAAAVWIGALLASYLLPNMPTRDAQALAAVSAVLGTCSPYGCTFAAARESQPASGSSSSPRRLLLSLQSGSSRSSCSSPATYRWLPFSAPQAFLCLHGLWCAEKSPRPTSPRKSLFRSLIILKHHQNIRRLAAGTENRFGARNHERKPA